MSAAYLHILPPPSLPLQHHMASSRHGDIFCEAVLVIVLFFIEFLSFVYLAKGPFDPLPHCVQWLKWFCEAGGGHLTKPGWSKPHTHSNPTNLALFGHKITLYIFNQGHILLQGAQIGAGGLSPPPGPLTLTIDCVVCGVCSDVVETTKLEPNSVSESLWSVSKSKCESLIYLFNIHLVHKVNKSKSKRKKNSKKIKPLVHLHRQ